jgi:Xaa-Pro aminopeptidase
MKAMHVGMSEKFKVFMNLSTKNTVVSLRLPSIVGAGNNGLYSSLHLENSKTRVENDLVLMDVGAEYHGYTADVTEQPANLQLNKN